MCCSAPPSRPHTLGTTIACCLPCRSSAISALWMENVWVFFIHELSAHQPFDLQGALVSSSVKSQVCHRKRMWLGCTQHNEMREMLDRPGYASFLSHMCFLICHTTFSTWSAIDVCVHSNIGLACFLCKRTTLRRLGRGLAIIRKRSASTQPRSRTQSRKPQSGRNHSASVLSSSLTSASCRQKPRLAVTSGT